MKRISQGSVSVSVKYKLSHHLIRQPFVDSAAKLSAEAPAFKKFTVEAKQ